MTATEYGSFRDELERLLEIRDQDLPELLRAARSFTASDAAEEIARIQDDHAVVEARIARLEQLLREATVVDVEGASDAVSVGCVVEVEYVSTGKVLRFRVTGIGMWDRRRTVTAASPVGQALMGRGPGALVSVAMPDGRVEELRILSVRAADDEPAHGSISRLRR